MLVFLPHGLIFIEAAGEFLGVKIRLHARLILELIGLSLSFLICQRGSLPKLVNEYYADGLQANEATAAVTPSATEAMKSRFNVSSVSVGRW